MPKGLNVLILGSGGREHALAWKASQSPKLKKLYAAPGSAAIAGFAECESLDILDPGAAAAFCKKRNIDLVIVGPEAPLAAGVADALREAAIKVFGPGQAGARLESSKSFAKAFMDRHKIPTARWGAFSEPSRARAAVKAMSPPVVVKADGLASGKGVRVCKDINEALDALGAFMERKILGPAGETILVESCLKGPEVSAMALVDGKNCRLLPLSCDHKRLLDGDQGPNTGGMGAYAPASLDAATLDWIRAGLFGRVVAGLVKDGIDYRGILYAGLMLTENGPQVLEFNCRFGDPETQAVLPLLKSDLLELALSCAEGSLDHAEIETRPGACVCVTLASEGYPDRPLAGRRIEGLGSLPESSDIAVFHAGTEKKGAAWLTKGGRVLGVTAVGAEIAEAREKAYRAVSRIRFEGMHYRGDIASKVLVGA